MEMQWWREKLATVLVFPVTPFHADLSLDLAGLRHNVDALITAGAPGLIAAGGTGEFYSLTPDEAIAVVAATCEAAQGRVPVIGGVGINTAIAAGLAQRYQDVGAAGVLALPPYYCRADFDGLFQYYRTIASAAPALGLIIYSRDWLSFTPEQVAHLTQIPTLVAFKDGQGDVRLFQRIRAQVGDRLIWLAGIGDDIVAPYVAAGAEGYTSSVGNFAPSVALALFHAAQTQDRDQLGGLLQRMVLPLYELRAARPGYEVSVIKAVMRELGLASGPVRPPLIEPREHELAAIHAYAHANASDFLYMRNST